MTLPPRSIQMSGMTGLWRDFYATHKRLPRGEASVGVVVLLGPDRLGLSGRKGPDVKTRSTVSRTTLYLCHQPVQGLFRWPRAPNDGSRSPGLTTHPKMEPKYQALTDEHGFSVLLSPVFVDVAAWDRWAVSGS